MSSISVPLPGSGQPDCVEDVGELYRELSRRLERIVRRDVRAPEPVIEDACQFAWGRLVHHAGRVRRETALSWLAKTAVHEAWKLIRREDRELSLDGADEGLEWPMHPSHAMGPQEIAEHRERLAIMRSLPPRQQRMLWLHALGLSYSEIAIQSACTVRTVERQLLRAKKTVRAADADQ